MKVYICSSICLGYFLFLEKILSNYGYEVVLVYLIEEKRYRKLAKANKFKKLWLRFQMYVQYPFWLIWKVWTSPKESLFIVTSNTFFAPYLAKVANFFNKRKVIHLLYDLFPDAMEAAGVITHNGSLSKKLGCIAKRNLKKTDATVYLGSVLKWHTEYRWGTSEVGKRIDIATDLSLFDSDLPNPDFTNKLIFHYGGQLGHLHDARSLINSIKKTLDSDIQENVEFNFYVSGAKAPYLQKSLEEFTVKIIPAVPSSKWREDIKNYHVGLVTLSPGGAMVCLPSKTYAMMGGGLAILAICPIWSDLANLILEMDAGWIINNSPYSSIDELKGPDYLKKIKETRSENDITDEFMEVVKNLTKNQRIIYEKRANAHKRVREKYNIELLGEEWNDVIREVI